MRKYHLYAAVLCSAAVLGLGGCSNKVDAATTLPLVNESRPVVVESEEPTSSAEETTVVETVSGTIESAEEQPEQAEDSVCLFGPATQMEDGRLSIDSQADQGYQGEVILNVSQESTYVLDAVSGLPIELSDIKDGDTIYAYIGPAMTMSLPPMTNATMIFANVPADFKVPDSAGLYIEWHPLSVYHFRSVRMRTTVIRGRNRLSSRILHINDVCPFVRQ